MRRNSRRSLLACPERAWPPVRRGGHASAAPRRSLATNSTTPTSPLRRDFCFLAVLARSPQRLSRKNFANSNTFVLTPIKYIRIIHSNAAHNPPHSA